MFLPFWMIPIQPYPDPKLLSSRVPTVLEPSQHPATSIGGALSGCVATDAAECPPPSPAEPWSWARETRGAEKACGQQARTRDNYKCLCYLHRELSPHRCL